MLFAKNEAIEKLKRDPETRDIPVIFISALGQLNDKVKAFSKGAVDYIAKPFQEEEVLARVATHLKLRRLHIQLEEQNRRLEREISDRIAAEQSLGESEEKYHGVFETTRAIKMIVDPENGKIVDANNNGLRDVEVYSGPVRIGNRNFCYSIVHDVSERKKLEAELERAKKFEAVGILAGGLAHDFNNLLNVVGGGFELIKCYMPEWNKVGSVFKNIETALEKAGALIRKIIDFSGRNASPPQRIDVRETVGMLSGKGNGLGTRHVSVFLPVANPLTNSD